MTITYEEVEKAEAAAPTPATAPAPAPAPAAWPAPAGLPSTGSHLPLILVLAVAFQALCITLTVLRRF